MMNIPNMDLFKNKANAKRVFNKFRDIKKNDFTLIFKGIINEDNLMVLKESFNKFSSSDILRKKIFSIFVEFSQNILKYSYKRKNEDSPYGFLVIEKNEYGYEISSGNYVTKEQKKILQDKLYTLNTSFENDGLDHIFRTKIKEPWSSKKSSELGLIDIIKKCKSKYNYGFIKEGDIYFFVISIVFKM